MNSEEFIDTLVNRSVPHIMEHLFLVIIPIGIALMVSFPLAVAITRPRFEKSSHLAMAIINLGQTIPPLAVISIFLPLLGLGTGPAIFALTIYSLLPITRNTITGFQKVPIETKEAARGMGMNTKGVFLQVELPLVLPLMFSGLKTSTVLTTGTATLASLVGAGGMGSVIFSGINFFKPELIVAGTLVVGLIALALERILTFIDYFLAPSHLK